MQEIADLSKKRREAAQAEADQIVADAKPLRKLNAKNVQAEMTALKTLSTKLNTQKLEQEKKAKQLAEREQDLKFGEEDLRIEQGDIPNKIKAGIEKAAGAIQQNLLRLRRIRSIIDADL